MLFWTLLNIESLPFCVFRVQSVRRKDDLCFFRASFAQTLFTGKITLSVIFLRLPDFCGLIIGTWDCETELLSSFQLLILLLLALLLFL